jgi:predicted MFS family arabinose efflux permease
MLGAMIGSIVLSSLVHQLGWQHTIAAGTILGVILIPLVWFIIHDKPQVLLQQKERPKTRYRETFTGLIKILKKPQMWLNGFIACLMYLALSIFAETWGIPFLTNVHHLTNENVASANSMVFLGWLVGGPLVGYISDITYSRKVPIRIGCLLSAFLITLIIYLPEINTSLLYLLLFLFGIFSSFEVLCFAISKEDNPHHLVATASSFTNLLTMTGGIIGLPLFGKILDLLWAGQTLNGDRIYDAINYKYALTILPLAFFLGFILTFWLQETHPEKTQTKK